MFKINETLWQSLVAEAVEAIWNKTATTELDDDFTLSLMDLTLIVLLFNLILVSTMMTTPTTFKVQGAWWLINGAAHCLTWPLGGFYRGFRLVFTMDELLQGKDRSLFGGAGVSGSGSSGQAGSILAEKDLAALAAELERQAATVPFVPESPNTFGLCLAVMLVLAVVGAHIPTNESRVTSVLEWLRRLILLVLCAASLLWGYVDMLGWQFPVAKRSQAAWIFPGGCFFVGLCSGLSAASTETPDSDSDDEDNDEDGGVVGSELAEDEPDDDAGQIASPKERRRVEGEAAAAAAKALKSRKKKR